MIVPMISQGEKIPSVPVKFIDAEGMKDAASDEVLGRGRVVLFAVPGAFTPTCHVNHLPGFIANADKLRAAGVARIVCAAVNDHHVMKAWGEATGALGRIDFIADAGAGFARSLGLDNDNPGLGGTRFRRSAMLIENGTVEAVFVEDAPGVTATGAPAILMALQAGNG
jgi:peroxiredoxin